MQTKTIEKQTPPILCRRYPAEKGKEKTPEPIADPGNQRETIQ